MVQLKVLEQQRQDSRNGLNHGLFVEVHIQPQLHLLCNTVVGISSGRTSARMLIESVLAFEVGVVPAGSLAAPTCTEAGWGADLGRGFLQGLAQCLLLPMPPEESKGTLPLSAPGPLQWTCTRADSES